jgi:hypothetical protein
MNHKQILAIALLLTLVGCATTPTTQPPKPIPAGCEQSIVYTKMGDFMPNGPMLTRVGVSTALAVLAVAEPQAGRAATLIMSTVMPMLYRATLSNNLAPVMAEVRAKFKGSEKYVAIATPLLVLFDSLNQAGLVQTGGVAMTDCDKGVLASLFKNIGLDSGADPALFQ